LGGEIVFVNPPYSRALKLWAKKCYEESKKPNTIIVMLIPARTDTSYFHDFIYGKAELRFIRGRLKFKNPNSSADMKKWTGSPFPSMLVIFK
jgi:site-specific DNA-methyltransferase (adenine-specific)